MITVVSCVWNRPERLEHTLEQLGRQTHANFELQLINNNIKYTNFVDDVVGKPWPFWITVTHNTVNAGPFARVKLMHDLAVDLSREPEHFMTLDDDAEFGPDLLWQWWDQRDRGLLQGWNGFKFKSGGTYWDRDEVGAGQQADYVWGSNLFLDQSLVLDPGITKLDQKWMQCDDLWLCYWVNHVERQPVYKGDVSGFKIEVDGKDTYLTQHNTKIVFLEYLRGLGWEV